jgi:archaemetzincin
MGLGYRPGNSCIISTFRVTKEKLEEQTYKLALHEFGHTQGLPHCLGKTCLMRDAEGKNHLDKLKGYCEFCKNYLKDKGFKLT